MKQLTQYIIALSNLYGLVSTQQVLDIYNSQNEKKVTISELGDELDAISEQLEENFIFIERDLFVHEAIYVEREAPHDIYKERSKWPYYIPEKEELLNYVDEYYFEKNETYREMVSLLSEKVTAGDTVLAEEIATEIHDHLTVNFNDISGAFNIVSDFDLTVDDDGTSGKLKLLIADYAISIRVWDQNGFSLTEMTEKLREITGHSGKSLEDYFLEADLLEKYIISMTHLYGRVTVDRVAEVYNLQNEDQITSDEVEEYLNNPPAMLEEMLVYIKFGEFVTEDLELFDGVYEKLAGVQKDKPFYTPDQDELFKYFNYNYTDYPKEYEKLIEFLAEKVYKGNYRQAEIRAEDVQLILQMGDGIEHALEVFAEDEFIFDDMKLLDGVVNHIKRLYTNTRMRDNNGLTPRELKRIEKEQRIQRVNIGRNDPCYCGSGKKYKKCCLIKDQA